MKNRKALQPKFLDALYSRFSSTTQTIRLNLNEVINLRFNEKVIEKLAGDHLVK